MTDHLEKKHRLKQDIVANRIRHCNLLMEGRTYYFFSEKIWRTYYIPMMSDMDAGTRNVLQCGTRYDFSGEFPDVMLRHYLRPSVIKNYLSIYELFINNLLSLWLRAYPGILNERTISFRDFYHASSKERVIDDVIIISGDFSNQLETDIQSHTTT